MGMLLKHRILRRDQNLSSLDNVVMEEEEDDEEEGKELERERSCLRTCVTCLDRG